MQWYFEHCDVQQITCAYSRTQIFTHSRTFITYKLTFWYTKAPRYLLVVCLFESSALVVFYVSVFAICVCLSVPPLLCFTPFLLLNVWPWLALGLVLLAIFYVDSEVVLVAMRWIPNFYKFSFGFLCHTVMIIKSLPPWLPKFAVWCSGVVFASMLGESTVANLCTTGEKADQIGRGVHHSSPPRHHCRFVYFKWTGFAS